jgi:alkaline phosphatase D
MKNSKAKWKIIGNQIIFSEFNVGWAGALNPAFGTPEQVESTFLDIWDGYPAERDQVIDYIKNNKINNVVWLTGDFHCSFAFDVAKRPSVFSPGNVPDYNPADGSGSVAVEFATPSISSANFDENIGAVNAATVQAFINKPFPENFPNIGGINPNPHMKNVDLIRHGYFILDLTETQAQADWFFVQTILEPKKEEGFQEGWFTLNNQNRLKKADSPAKNKTNQDKPAPDEPIILGKNDPSELVVFGIYPNPAADVVFVNYALNRPEKVRISLFDNEGKEVLLLKDEPQNPNNYTFAFSLEDFKAGVYHLVFYIGDNLLTRKIVKM